MKQQTDVPQPVRDGVGATIMGPRNVPGRVEFSV